MDWFDTYKEKLAHRANTMKVALDHINLGSDRIMVETGCIRMKDDWGAGMSTLVFGDFAKTFGLHLYTVDISPENIELCKEITKEYKEAITYTVNDSIGYLQTFKKTIDFLYLDSMDCPVDDPLESPVLQRSQHHQLEEFKAAEDKLSPHAVVVLDDCRFANGGKCGMSKPYLMSRGWHRLLEEYQSVWTR